MGFNIHIAREIDGKLVDDSDAPDYPAPGWDGCRYGWDYDYISDLYPGPGEPGAYGHETWATVYDPKGRWGEDERVFRPTAERLKMLREKYPDNGRCQRLCDLLESDDTAVVFVT